MSITLVAIVVIVLLGLAVIGLVTWLLLRPKKAPAPQPYGYGAPAEGQPAQAAYPASRRRRRTRPALWRPGSRGRIRASRATVPAAVCPSPQPYGAPMPGGQYPAQPPVPVPPAPAPTPAPGRSSPGAPAAVRPAARAGAPGRTGSSGTRRTGVPSHASRAPAPTWTAQVTEPGIAQVDDSELDETTRLREDLRPALGPRRPRLLPGRRRQVPPRRLVASPSLSERA
ncbi:hypothetical protein NKG05_09450 [Oerskovia sp. M15]